MSLVEQALESDHLVRSEGTKLWNQISQEERDALIDIVSLGPEAVTLDMRRQLVQRGIMINVNNPNLCARLFTRYVQRQGLARQVMPNGVYLDIDARDVWDNGTRVQTLTELEYRLLLLM